MSDDNNIKAEMKPAQNPWHFPSGKMRREVRFHSELFSINTYQDSEVPDKYAGEDAETPPEDPDGDSGLSDHQKYIMLMNEIYQNQERYEILEAMGGVKTWGNAEGDLFIHVQYIEYKEDEDEDEADKVDW